MIGNDEKGKIRSVPKPLVIVIALSILAVGVITFMGEEPPGGKKTNQVGLPEKEEAINRSFRIMVRGEIIHYKEMYTWSEKNYVDITENKAGFRTVQVQNFEETYDMEPKFHKTRFIKAELTTLFECEIREKVTENKGKFTANLSWLLNPYGLSLVENEFEETKTELKWHGELDQISTGIIIDLPPQENKYSEWGEPAGYNHSTIWWSENIPD